MKHAERLEDMPRDQVVFHRALRRREREPESLVESAVCELATSGRLSRIEDNAAWGLFFLRVDAALHLLEWSMSPEEPCGPRLVPAPRGTREDLLRWLLDDWWHHAGRALWLAWLAGKERAAE